MTDKDSVLSYIKTSENFSFSDYTTYRLGGKAKIAYFPKTEAEAAEILNYIQKNGQKYIIIGKGSNILASENFFDGSVICTKYLKGIIKGDSSLYCLAGTTANEIIDYCLNHNLGGFEYLSQIPASIGGLAYMNGGLPQRHICSDVLEVRVAYDGKIVDFSNNSCNFGDKHSTMCDIKCLILGVKLKVYSADTETSLKRILQIRTLRKSQPKGRSCGCVFKNPNGCSAGKLIDEAGLKGFRIGSAQVSPKHANFIISDGESSSDVFNLIKAVKNTVFEKLGVKLEEEVIYIGEFNDFDS